MGTSKDDLIRRLDAARQTMRDVLADTDPDMELYPGWTAKHLLAHIAGWDDASISSLRAYARGDTPATPAVQGINFYNAQTVATREALRYDQVVQEWELAREQLKAAILEMPPEKIDDPLLFPWGGTGTTAQLVEIFAGHEEEHAADVRRLKEQTP